MPSADVFVSCAKVKNKIIISSLNNNNILSFEPSSESYNRLDLDLHFELKWLVSTNGMIYVFLDDKIHEINAYGNIANTFVHEAPTHIFPVTISCVMNNEIFICDK